MNIARIKKAEKRVAAPYVCSLNIKAYGQNNIYPQQAKAILDASSTGAQCADRYARFIEGEGFVNLTLYDLVCNRMGDTADTLLSAVAQDIATYGGFALLANYDLNLRVREVQHMPFEDCRLEEADDSGYIAHIVTHDGWDGTATHRGKRVAVNAENVTRYDVFNPKPEIVRAQILAAGGIDNYKGQILWVSMAGGMRYPLPKYDRVLTDLSTDEGLSNIKFRNARCNFLSSAFVITKRSQARNDDDRYKQKIDERGFADDLADFQGDETANVLINMTVENDDEKPEIISFPVKNFDKDFEVTDNSVVERIYSSFEQEPFLCIRNGKLGFSGSVIEDCYNYYSSLVNKEQRTVERAFSRIFSIWHEPLANDDTSIQPLTFKATQQ